MGSINWKVYFILISLCLIISSATAITIDYPNERPSIESGKKIYLSNCAGCHGEKGDGSTFSGVFNFTNSEKMITSNSSIFFEAITNGIPGTAMLDTALHLNFALMIAGVIQVYQQRVEGLSFMSVQNTLLPYFGWRLIGGLIAFAGGLLIAYDLILISIIKVKGERNNINKEI